MENKAILPDNILSTSNWHSGKARHLNDGVAFEPLSAETLMVDIVVPVYNEGKALAHSVMRLEKYLVANFPYRYRITIADNGSTDATGEIAGDLSERILAVRAIRLDKKRSR